MGRRYKHLNSKERGVIFAEHRPGTSLRTIESLLSWYASTIQPPLGIFEVPGSGSLFEWEPEKIIRQASIRALHHPKPAIIASN